jgi:hypothetical protein
VCVCVFVCVYYAICYSFINLRAINLWVLDRLTWVYVSFGCYL